VADEWATIVIAGSRRYRAEHPVVMSNASHGNVRLPVLAEVVAFPSEVHAADSAQMAAKLFGACRPGVPVVIADLSLAKTCDSSTIRYLIAASKQAAMFGVELRVVIPSADVLRKLQLFGADQALQVYPSVEDALMRPE
jgi:anti-anti-sigma regulatory factor